jgi:hypothetical protein
MRTFTQDELVEIVDEVTERLGIVHYVKDEVGVLHRLNERDLFNREVIEPIYAIIDTIVRKRSSQLICGLLAAQKNSSCDNLDRTQTALRAIAKPIPVTIATLYTSLPSPLFPDSIFSKVREPRLYEDRIVSIREYIGLVIQVQVRSMLESHKHALSEVSIDEKSILSEQLKKDIFFLQITKDILSSLMTALRNLCLGRIDADSRDVSFIPKELGGGVVRIDRSAHPETLKRRDPFYE